VRGTNEWIFGAIALVWVLICVSGAGLLALRRWRRRLLPEAFCERCHRPSVAWFAPSPLWNAAHGEYDILCPVLMVCSYNERGMMMTRQEHLEWCKQRALAYCDVGDATNAWASMASDLSKHPETENHAAIQLGMMMFMGGMLNGVSEMRKFIEGFN
jgi:hypothetical protein